MLSEKQILEKADVAISDMSSVDGILLPDVADSFYRKVMDEPSILNDARTVQMSRPNMKWPAIAFASRLLRKGKNNFTGEANATRAMDAADRYKPTFSTLELNTDEVIGQIDIPYEVLEDNIEGGDIDRTRFQSTVLDMMAAQAALDLEELVVQADTASGDSYLAMTDGVLKLATANVVNVGAGVSVDMFADMIDALPDKYHRNLPKMRFYTSRSREITYRAQVAQRQTSLGDAVLTGTTPLSVMGVRMQGVSAIANDKALLTDPRNILVGMWRQFRLETDRDITARLIKIVLTMRVGVQIQENEMMVKATNIS